MKIYGLASRRIVCYVKLEGKECFTVYGKFVQGNERRSLAVSMEEKMTMLGAGRGGGNGAIEAEMGQILSCLYVMLLQTGSCAVCPFGK